MKQTRTTPSRLSAITLLILVIFAVQPLQCVTAAKLNVSVPQTPAAMLVNSTGDAPDSAVADGHCDTDASLAGDQCTLRAAIQELNVTAAAVINFNLPPNSTIVLNSELEALTGMTINGPGSGLLTVKRNSAAGTPHFRIFTVTGPAVVTMIGLTITNGRAPDGTVSPNGGPGGGIHNLGNLELRDVVVIGNRAGNGRNDDGEHPTGGTGGSGGGILSQGPLTLIDSVITQNQAGDGGFANEGGGGGGVGAGRGGLMINTTISNNTAGNGGVGKDQLGGRGGQGGGLAAGNVMTIINSTITGNKSGRGGDGIAFFGAVGGDGGGISNSARMTIVNTTISDNQTGDGGTGTQQGGLGGFGAGIHNTAPQLILANCTIAGNKTNGFFGGSGGGISSPSVGIGILKNTIVANNAVATGVAQAGEGPDLFGNFTSQDYNLIENTAGASITGVTTHNVTGVDPNLGPLSNNGGRTLTHALLPGSPAINAGNNGNLEPDDSDLDNDGNLTEPIPFDQRGVNFPRVLSGTVDIGAFEGVAQIVAPPELRLDTSGPAVDQLAALDSVFFVRDPFQMTRPAIFPGQEANARTRVIIFASNLNLAANAPAGSVIVTLVDAQNKTFEIAAEDVRSVPGVDFSQVIFRLPDTLATGTCKVKISVAGRVSNTGTIRVV